MFKAPPVAPPPPHSAYENAEVAIETWFHNALLAVTNCVSGKTKERIRYADLSTNENPEDDEEKDFPLFHTHQHKKYFAHMYFKAPNEMDEIDGDEAPILQMEDPKRSDAAQRAYDDFLRGLEMINQQEYLKKEFCGKGWTEKVIQDEESQKRFLPNFPEHKKVQTQQDIWEKAMWERGLTLRTHAKTARSFYEQLKDRADAKNTEKPAGWLSKDDDKITNDKARKKRLRRPPIRWKTFELLTRPLEADWNWGLGLSWAFTIFTYCFTLYTQIQAIADMCSGGYICPIRDVQIPLIAPPVAYRQPSTNAIWYKSRFGNTWDPVVKKTCSVIDSGCDDPGYKIQWPYVQVDRSAKTAELPDGLLSKCEPKKDKESWIWNPFTLTNTTSGTNQKSLRLMNEYLDCSGVGKDLIAFEQGGIPFHFDRAWYDEAKDRTVACMKESAPKYGLDNFEQWLGTDDEAAFVDSVELCVGSNSDLQDMANMCQCSTSLPSFPIRHFYAGTPIQTCDGGSFDGNLCDNNDQCGDQEPSTCTVRFEDDHNSLATSPLFGCFFEEPWADEREQPRYHICGMTLESKTDAAGNLKSKLQRAVTPNIISKKAGLMITFAIKEASYLTGMAVLLLGGIAGFIICLPLIIAYEVLHKLWGKSAPVADSQLLQFKDMVGAILWAQVLTLWSTCVNFSTFYRMIKFAISLGSGHVNVSIHDLDKKLTGVANLMFNLVLLVFQDDVSTTIYVSLALSLALLLYQMNAEKQGLRAIADVLKDINEMRLSKFEMALGLTKVMEDMLEYDIEYNWVAHFYNKEKLYPLEAAPSHHDDPFHNRDLTQEEEDKVTLRFMPTMDTATALQFGHDGMGRFEKKFQRFNTKEVPVIEAHKLSKDQLNKIFTGRPTEPPEHVKRLTNYASNVKIRSHMQGSWQKPGGGPVVAAVAGAGLAGAPAGMGAAGSKDNTISSSSRELSLSKPTSPPSTQMIGGFQYNMQNMSGMGQPMGGSVGPSPMQPMGGFNPYGGARGYPYM